MKLVFFSLIGIVCLCGCYSGKGELKRHGLGVGHVPGPFFHYGQTTLAQSRHFDLGDIPTAVHTIEAVVPFSNRGEELLIIKKVDGLCSGFFGWEGENQVAAGQTGTIIMLFNKDNFESGSATCSVCVYTNDPANSKVTLFFDFNVIRKN